MRHSTSISDEKALGKSQVDAILKNDKEYQNESSEHEYHSDELRLQIPEHVSQEIIDRIGGDTFQTAEENIRGSIRSVRPSEIAEFAQYKKNSEKLEARRQTRETLRAIESIALEQWAIGNGKFTPEEDFDKKWNKDGARHGGEHDVYFDAKTGRWIKRTKLNFSGVHLDYLEYLQRMFLHAYLYGYGVAPRLEGVTEKDGAIEFLISQPDVKGEGATTSEIDDMMSRMGFNPYPAFAHDAYINYKTGVVIRDLREENALIVKNDKVSNSFEMAVIDPVIVLDSNSKLRRQAEATISIVIVFFLLIVFGVLLGSYQGNDTALRKKTAIPDEKLRMHCLVGNFSKGEA